MNASEQDRMVFATGTTQPVSAPSKVAAGLLTALIDDGALRDLRIGPVELVRAIDFPIRDENWATLIPTVTSENLTVEGPDSGGSAFHYERRAKVAGGALSYSIVFEGHADESLVAVGEVTAAVDFYTNRAGFTVLHPLDGVSGQPVGVTTPDGHKQSATMPELISPGQPITDIAGLAFQIHGISAELTFEGETFEMEDQRNWSDASFKTYCRPLREPFPYLIPAGSTFRQEIRLTVAGPAPNRAAPFAKAIEIGAALDERLPRFVLGGEPGWLPTAAQAHQLLEGGLGSLSVRVTPRNASVVLSEASVCLDTTGGSLDLEVVLDDDEPAPQQLAVVAGACADLSSEPVAVTALPAAYLKSYQPNDVWPTGLSPGAAIDAARASFPDARIGAGMLTNFTEFNRCRPQLDSVDFITHGNSATVHAPDDRSVNQTLTALPDIFRTARSIGGGLPYRLGLTAIGMRSNPYGSAVSPNPSQVRSTMTTWDPRARSTFGAAWALGALAATEGFGIEAITLAAPVGPFGLFSDPGPVSRPWYDQHPEAAVYPIFHVLSFFGDAGAVRHRVIGLPEGVCGVAAALDSEARLIRLVVANVAEQPRTVTFVGGGRWALISPSSFSVATTAHDWLDNSLVADLPDRVTLEPTALLFAELHTDVGGVG